MLPRSSLTLLLAGAVGPVAVYACICLSGTSSETAAALCAFALFVGAPIVVLVWLGSLSDPGHVRAQRKHQLKKEKLEAHLWQSTLLELERCQPALADGAEGCASKLTHSGTASAPPQWRNLKHIVPSRILALIVAGATTLGLMGCYHTSPANWAMVRPGLGTSDVVALVGAPEQIKSNGSEEVWQYCRDFFGRGARYYMAVLIDNDVVRDVRPYPVWSGAAGCEDFYRTGF